MPVLLQKIGNQVFALCGSRVKIFGHVRMIPNLEMFNKSMSSLVQWWSGRKPVPAQSSGQRSLRVTNPILCVVTLVPSDGKIYFDITTSAVEDVRIGAVIQDAWRTGWPAACSRRHGRARS